MYSLTWLRSRIRVLVEMRSRMKKKLRK